MRYGVHRVGFYIFAFVAILVLAVLFLFGTSTINTQRRLKYARLLADLQDGTESLKKLFGDFPFLGAKKNFASPLSVDAVESILQQLKTESFEVGGIRIFDFKTLPSFCFCIITISKTQVTYIPGGGETFSVDLNNYEVWRLQLGPDLKKVMITSTKKEDNKSKVAAVAFCNALVEKIG